LELEGEDSICKAEGWHPSAVKKMLECWSGWSSRGRTAFGREEERRRAVMHGWMSSDEMERCERWRRDGGSLSVGASKAGKADKAEGKGKADKAEGDAT